MPIGEYHKVHGNLKSIKQYKLLSAIIMHYSFSMEEVPIVPVKHGNAKQKDARVFRPTQHSVKIECRETVEKSQKAPRHLTESIGDADISVIESTSSSTQVRSPKQVSNYWSNYG